MILLGADPLSRFLNRAVETDFVWGTFDCLLLLADWIRERRGIDLAADLRGTYSTMLGAARIVKGAGGMSRLVDGRLRSAGLSRAKCGARGDIAIVSVGGEGGNHFGNEAGAILLSGSAALISQGGLVLPRLSDLTVVAAWRI